VAAVDTPANLTARLKGSETIYLKVDTGSEDASQVLRQMSGVTRVSMTDSQDRIVGYEVESQAGQDIRRDLARTVVQNGWGLLEMRPLRMSLEDIFLHLTTEEPPALHLTAEELPAEVARG
jgi:ABC-2 type transport system ATP-binding protein